MVLAAQRAACAERIAWAQRDVSEALETMFGSVLSASLDAHSLPATARLFVSLAGTPVIYSGFARTFHQAVLSAGVGAEGSTRPRAHDLRHSFAVRTLLGWYRAGLDVEVPSAQAFHLSRAPRAALHLPLPHRHP